MLKLKARPERSKSAVKNLIVAIMCGANLLPVKGLIYAMSHARASRYVSSSQGKQAQANMKRLSKNLKELSLTATDLQKLQEVSGTALHRLIKNSTSSYIDMFYDLEPKERELYLASSGATRKKIANERNLLILPAMMASRGEPKAEVVHHLVNAVYKIPYHVLYHSSKAAIHTELLQQAIGFKSAPDEAVMGKFSDVLNRMDSRMKEIELGGIKPEHDESLKQEFVTEAVMLSQATDMHIADFMSEKIMPNAFTDRMARRIIRKHIGR